MWRTNEVNYFGDSELAVAIASAGSLSGAASLLGLSLCGIVMPASWTTANLTFQVSRDGTTFVNLYDKSGNEYTVTAAASRGIIVPWEDFALWRYVKVRSGTAGAPVAQDAARSLILMARPF